MSNNDDKLKSVNLPGQEEPEIYSVSKEQNGFTLSRRKFLGATGVTAGALAAMSGNSRAELILGSEDGYNSHPAGIEHLCLSPDGQYLISSCSSKTKQWKMIEGELLNNIAKSGAVMMSPDGSHTIQLSDNVNIYISTSLGNGSYFSSSNSKSLAFTPNGKYLAIGSNTGKIGVWSPYYDSTFNVTGVPKYSLKIELSEHLSSVNALAFSPDGQWMASGGIDAEIKIWSVEDWSVAFTLNNSLGTVTSIAFSPKGDKLLSACSDNTIKVWTVPTGELQMDLNMHTDSVNTLAVSSDGKRFASGSSDNSIIIWSLETLAVENIFNKHTDSVNSVVFSPDCKWLISGSDDKTIKLWEMPEGNRIFSLYDQSETTERDSRKYSEYDLAIKKAPCETPLPAGATCICNCVSTARTYTTSETICTCNTVTVPASNSLPGGSVCVCNTVSTGTYCSCDSYTSCSCHGYSSCSCTSKSYSYYYTYWYPN